MKTSTPSLDGQGTCRPRTSKRCAMGRNDLQRNGARHRTLALAAASVFALAAPAFAADNDENSETRTPIKHVIIIIGENRTFDHLFATYKPVHRHEKVWNLLSRGIVREDGAPGPNYAEALQYQAPNTTTHPLTPPNSPYPPSPPPLSTHP